MKSIVLASLILSLISSAHSFAGGVAGCCAVACGGEAAAITVTTGGLALPLEVAHIAFCVGECVSSGGFIMSLMTGGVPLPVCAWGWLLPF